MKRSNTKVKIAFNSPVILVFTAICFVALIFAEITNGYTNQLIFSTYRASWGDPMSYVRIIGHVFGHAGWDHFIGNIMTLLIIGPLLEEKYGSLSIGVVIFTTAIITGIFHNTMFNNVMLLGASGVVFAFILLSSITSIRERSIPLTFILVAIIYMSREIYTGIIGQDNTSHLTHILGGIVGAGLGYAMNKYELNKRK